MGLRIRRASWAQLVDDVIVNLSPGGLFVQTDDLLPIDTEVDLEIGVLDDENLTHVRGRVVWVKPPPDGGMGIQFIGLMGPKLTEIIRRRADR